MSYIYEALKRAESENARALGAPAPVRRPALFAARWRWWLWLLIGVLGTNAAVVVTLVLVRGSRSPRPTMAPTSSADSGAGPVTSRRGAESADETPSAPPPIPAAEVAPTPAAKPPARTVTPAARPSARPASPAPTPTVTEPRPASPPTPEATAAVSQPGISDAPPVSPSAPRNTPPTAVDEPKLQVQVVVYSDVPAERMVFINGRRYAEGDKVDAETVVERITPQGVVVTHRGQRFALTSGRP